MRPARHPAQQVLLGERRADRVVLEQTVALQDQQIARGVGGLVDAVLLGRVAARREVHARAVGAGADVIGGGLRAARRPGSSRSAGVPVVLHEMRPTRADRRAPDRTRLAELVCSNSFRSDDWENNAVGLLHEEMRRAGSLIMAAADAHKRAGRRRAGRGPRRVFGAR